MMPQVQRSEPAGQMMESNSGMVSKNFTHGKFWLQSPTNIFVLSF
jgi:hypothetical protein